MSYVIGYEGLINGFGIEVYDHDTYQGFTLEMFKQSNLRHRFHANVAFVDQLCQIAVSFGASYNVYTTGCLEFDDREFYNFLLLAMQDTRKIFPAV